MDVTILRYDRDRVRAAFFYGTSIPSDELDDTLDELEAILEAYPPSIGTVRNGLRLVDFSRSMPTCGVCSMRSELLGVYVAADGDRAERDSVILCDACRGDWNAPTITKLRDATPRVTERWEPVEGSTE